MTKYFEIGLIIYRLLFYMNFVEEFTIGQSIAFENFIKNMNSFDELLLIEPSMKTLQKDAFYFYPRSISLNDLPKPGLRKWIKNKHAFSVECNTHNMVIIGKILYLANKKGPIRQENCDETRNYKVWLYNAINLKDAKVISATWCVQGMEANSSNEILNELSFLREFMDPVVSANLFGL